MQAAALAEAERAEEFVSRTEAKTEPEDDFAVEGTGDTSLIVEDEAPVGGGERNCSIVDLTSPTGEASNHPDLEEEEEAQPVGNPEEEVLSESMVSGIVVVKNFLGLPKSLLDLVIRELFFDMK